MFYIDFIRIGFLLLHVAIPTPSMLSGNSTILSRDCFAIFSFRFWSTAPVDKRLIE